MSIRSAIDRVLRQRLGIGHVTWPTFGMTVSIGDSARVGPQGYEFVGLGNLLERYDLTLADYQYVVEAAPIEIEFEDGVERQGSLSGAARSGASATVELSFRAQHAFYLFVPEARIRYIRDVERLMEDLGTRSRAAGERVGLTQRIVYKTISAEGEGMLLVCRSRAASTRLSISAGAAGDAALTLGETTGEVLQLRVNAASSVFAFSDLRRAIGSRRYVLDPRG